ncbi:MULTISPECIES: 16S rRNA (cytosine(967)-C(5))-methyltransferase RsmB [unclassified Paenibacillus]|uniref:16S rRNA (cytosine(967)-C(5))-methyltransferase RsmB n=2 Tax=Paenibacillus TaxID=44249 RepID=UPI00095438CD|nr:MULTISPECIES: 16S rRNA (cytosine(967)-C(5))-methyltransferase RsmB [unclassified Paenibacillus]SIQ22168.1 16S rRNA (cytosine967-C5)-methyltransferase [Paenibacillus sp. RU4X]SIQ43867.1 16S rRNA (cytosine967-C5)-methyltransferase [Paenibacillus sp. RU4T]
MSGRTTGPGGQAGGPGAAGRSGAKAGGMAKAGGQAPPKPAKAQASAGQRGRQGSAPVRNASGQAGSGTKPAAGKGAERQAAGQGQHSRGSAASRQPRSARELALDALIRVERDGAYSNLQLNRALLDSGLSRADSGLATELVYGTLQRRLTLDHWLAGFIPKGLRKLEPWVLSLLRMSLYQLVYLDRVPAHAAVNEAVNIGRRRGHSGIAGMVNGVLRSVVRQLPRLKAETFAAEADAPRRLSLRHSYPQWLAERWISALGEEAAEAVMASGNEAPHGSLRLNPLRTTPSEALRLLEEAGLAARPASALPDSGIVVDRGGNLAMTDGYAKGLWSIQDESSMLVAAAANPRPGSRVLDCCAAPGGKSTHLAELMGDRGEVVSNDLHAHKLALIEDNAKRLGLRAVHPVTGDAAELGRLYPAESFDLVLLDAPCSGLGVIRRKPEIKWTKSEGDIKDIAALQTRLLEAAAGLVKPGGVLLYSTCTIEHSENAGQVAAFLGRHPEYALDPGGWPEKVLEPLRAAGVAGAEEAVFDGSLQLLPQHFGSDGFYIARLTKKAD